MREKIYEVECRYTLRRNYEIPAGSPDEADDKALALAAEETKRLEEAAAKENWFPAFGEDSLEAVYWETRVEEE